MRLTTTLERRHGFVLRYGVNDLERHAVGLLEVQGTTGMLAT